LKKKDKIGLHKVGNPSTEKPAISLHLYTPPYEVCRTFCEKSGRARAGGKCLFFSKFGQKQNVTANLLNHCPLTNYILSSTQNNQDNNNNNNSNNTIISSSL